MNEVTARYGDFRDGLRDVANRLSLPLTTRLRILRELQADHVDTVARLMERGIPEAEARHRARTALLPDGETLAALERLHQPLYRRLTRNVENHRLQQLERWALLGTTAAVVALGVSALLRGVLGTLIGITIAAQAIEAAGNISTSLVWGGIKVALITSEFGMLILVVAALIWFGLQFRWRMLEARELARADPVFAGCGDRAPRCGGE
jgi:hypothetical protein